MPFTTMFPFLDAPVAAAQLNDTETVCELSGDEGAEALASMNPLMEPVTSRLSMVKLELSSVNTETDPNGSGQGLLPTKCSSNKELGDTSRSGNAALAV